MARTVVVTGATGAAGHAVCAALVSAGHTVIAVGSDAERLSAVTATHQFVCDLTDADATNALAARAHAELGAIDGLVHLVGGWRGGHDTEGWDWLEPRILTTLRNATIAFHDDLSASTAGRLVVVGSASAEKPTWSGANYAALKSAADAWVVAVASGWRKAGRAAAVTFVVDSILVEPSNDGSAGADGTSPHALAEAILPLWSQPASELNGVRVAV